MVYREFADREALVAAVAVAAFVRLAEQVHAASSGLRDVRAIGRAYVAFALAHPAEFEIMFAGGRRGDLPTELPSAYTALESVLDDLAAAGRLPPGTSRDDAALVCWTSVHGVAWLLVDRALAGYPRSDPGDVVEVVLDHLVRSLILRPVGGASSTGRVRCRERPSRTTCRSSSAAVRSRVWSRATRGEQGDRDPARQLADLVQQRLHGGGLGPGPAP
jgi:AcrR family transcriptional regulator